MTQTKYSFRRVVPATLALLVAGCAVQTDPMTTTEHVDRVRHDLGAIFADQEPIAAPITLTEALARSLKYNLDHRLKIMEDAVALRQSDVADMALLPQVVVQLSAYESARRPIQVQVKDGDTGPIVGAFAARMVERVTPGGINQIGR